MKFLFNLIVLFLLAGDVFGLDTYPEWFLYPKDYPDIIVGYSYSGTVPKIDAERMYCAYRHCIVNGVLELDQKSDLRNSNYFYYFSPDSLLNIKDKLFEVDYFINSIITSDYIAAYSTDSTRQLPSKYISLDTVKQPDWLEKTFWEQSGYFYGVGIFSSRANKNDAWKTAEERAIFSILNSVIVQIHSVRIMRNTESDGSDLNEIQAIRLRFEIKNIQPVERWNDQKNQLFYVLVRIRENNVVPLF